jgi:glutaredoxin
MKTEQQINKEIEDLQKEMKSLKGTKTEVYTRIVGYYRSVKNWNKGKREEFDRRITFSSLVPHTSEEGFDTVLPSELKENPTMQAPIFSKSVAYYSYFFRNTCPKCPPVKKYIQSLSLDGTEINVDNETGIEQAIEHNVTASPTVIFFDQAGQEVFRAHDIEKLEEHHGILKA